MGVTSVMGKRAKACAWRFGQTAKRRLGFVFSGEAEIQDSLERSPRNCNKTGDQPWKA
jgi:hypothetical protein